MPWNIKKRNNKYCVYKEDGTLVYCHKTQRMANRQIQALYASETEVEKAAGGFATSAPAQAASRNYGAKVGEVIAGRLKRGAGGKFESAAGQAINDSLSTIGVGKAELDALESFNKGGSLSAEAAEKLVQAGLVKANPDGTFSSTADGKGILAAIRKKDARKAADIVNKIKNKQDKKAEAEAKKNERQRAAEEKRAARQAEQEAKRAEAEAQKTAQRQANMTKTDEAMKRAGLEDFNELVKYAGGDNATPEALDRLIKNGMLERGMDGIARMTRHGNAALAAADRGDTRRAVDSLSQGREEVTRKTGEANAAIRRSTRLTRKECNELEEIQELMEYGGATSFRELEAAEVVEEAGEEIAELTEDFTWLAHNIMTNPTILDKGAALKRLSAEYADRVDRVMAMGMVKEVTEPEPEKAPEDEKGLVAKIVEGVKDFFKAKKPYRLAMTAEEKAMCGKMREAGMEADGMMAEDDEGMDFEDEESMTTWQEKMRLFAESAKKEVDHGGLTVWKEANGIYRWFAVYSNHFRDRDNPPEILASEAHKEFVAAVDAGETPYPELWHWHLRGTTWGKADWLAYDEDTGFSMASGYILPGHEKEADVIASLPNVKVSHGMNSVARDEEDKSIIRRYRTVEISALPGWAAANELTGFNLEKMGDTMIPEAKKEHLRKFMSEDQIAKVEQVNKERAEAAMEAGIEFKETEAATEVVAEVQAVNPDFVTREEVAGAVAEVVNPLVEALQQMNGILEAQSKELAALKAADAQKLQKQVQDLPKASLSAILKERIYNAPEAEIRPGELDGPLEKSAENTGPGLWFQRSGWTH